MSEKVARTHTHISNRAKPKPRGGDDRKVVFKSVLDNPFRISWPSVPINLQNSILAQVTLILDGVSEYHRDRDQANRKRKRAQKVVVKGDANKKQKLGTEEVHSSVVVMGGTGPDKFDLGLRDQPPATNSEDPVAILQPQAPMVLEHLTIGINAVTKRLELQIRDARRMLVVANSEQGGELKPAPTLKAIFACRADVDPPVLIDHLPHLVAAYNSLQSQIVVKIVPLPKGAEYSLAQATGLRRVAVMAIDSNLPEISTFFPLLDTVPTLTASWLAAVPASSRFVPTHIKQVRTSAPKDMRASKEKKTQGKALAKQRRQSPRQALKGKRT